MNTTQTTAALLATLTNKQSLKLSRWCRDRAAKLATMDKAGQQGAIREQIELLKRW